MQVLCPVSVGEIVDKVSILEIKTKSIVDAQKLANVHHEYNILIGQYKDILDRFSLRYGELYTVNFELWNVEDRLRDMERKRSFGPDFVSLARSVYRLNDKRAAIKLLINLESGSNIVEQKSYSTD